ncbi:uridine monophosphate kinase [Thermodesulfobacteriota bacterium]
MSREYRRALLKVSGEALGGERGHGLDRDKIGWIASEISQAVTYGCELGVVIGGGNILRGADSASVGVPPVVGDQMGMVATIINAMALGSALVASGTRAVVMAAFPVGNFVETFVRSKALAYLENGYVTVFGGGTGNPCFTTDSAAALRAVEIEAEVMVKATQVPWVYDKDPKKYSDAKPFETISPDEVLKRRLGVIDATCVEILGRRSIPVLIMDLHKEGNIRRAMAGEKVGTVIA